MDLLNIKGRDYRVECNWKACMDFLKAKGTDSIEGLTNIATLAPSDLSLLAICCIREGERLEGRDCELDNDFIDTLPMVEALAVVGRFIAIYSAQSQPRVTEADDKKKD